MSMTVSECHHKATEGKEKTPHKHFESGVFSVALWLTLTILLTNSAEWS